MQQTARSCSLVSFSCEIVPCSSSSLRRCISKQLNVKFHEVGSWPKLSRCRCVKFWSAVKFFWKTPWSSSIRLSCLWRRSLSAIKSYKCVMRKMRSGHISTSICLFFANISSLVTVVLPTSSASRRSINAIAVFSKSLVRMLTQGKSGRKSLTTVTQVVGSPLATNHSPPQFF